MTEKKRSNLPTIIGIVLAVYILFNANLRDMLGRAVGVVMNPLIGFNGNYPVITIMLAGTFMVLVTTVIRHFTTDWLETARNQAAMKHFQAEFKQARADQNTYRVKKLQEYQPKMQQEMQKTQMKSMKSMPFTMLIVIPFFAWILTFVNNLPYWYYATPWNPEVNMFTTEGIVPGLGSLFPHYILLYMVLSIPLGALVGKAMKYLSWKERWQSRHPEVHE